MKAKLSLVSAIFAALFFSTIAQAQITISNTYFPANGDALISASATPATAAQVQPLLIPAGGATKTWDFSFLRPAVGSTDTVRFATISDTNLTKAFPAAKLQSKTRSPQVSAYNVTTTNFELVGVFNGSIPGFNFNLPQVLRFNPVTLERRAPLTSTTTGTASSAFSLAVKISDLPQAIRDQLPSAASLADSIRGSFRSTRTDNVDSWGTLKLGATTYNVLRERRAITANITVEARTFLGWIDVTSFLSGQGVVPETKTVEYLYWTNQAGVKEPLVTVVTNEGGATVTGVSYRPFAAPSNVADQFDGTLTVFPNPTTEAIFIDLKNTKATVSAVQVADVSGRVLLQQKIQGNVLNNYRLDVRNLTNGTYFLSLNTEGGILTTKSFIVQR